MNKTLILAFTLLSKLIFAQHTFSLYVLDAQTKRAVAFVTIAENQKQIGVTDTSGLCILKLEMGKHPLVFSLIGYETKPYTISIITPQIDKHLNDTILLVPNTQALDEVVIVSTSRTNSSIENSALKIEVLAKEEIDEESSIKPGNVASIIGDVSGVQIQQSSVITGNSNVRIQGLDGKYTQLLRDGMPMYEGFSGGFGILSTPPLDLQQIEMVKGSASTLYGGGAIGGLINLISRKPKMTQEADALVNGTTLKEANANIFLAKRNAKLGYTLFTGTNQQSNVDVNKDGLSDLPDAQSYLFHPRIYYYPTERTVIYAGYNFVADTRTGGDLYHPQEFYVHYVEKNNSLRNTAEFNLEHTYPSNAKLIAKSCFSNFNRNTSVSNGIDTHGKQQNFFNEVTYLKSYTHTNLVSGGNFYSDQYTTLAPTNSALKQFSNNTLGLFFQGTFNIKKLTIESGVRYDYHFTYKSFLLPRIAAFYRINKAYAIRLGYGRGYKTPNPLVQQNVDYSIVQLTNPTGINPEHSNGLNAEINYKIEFGQESSLFINEALFYTEINRPVIFSLDPISNLVSMKNVSGNIISKGSDTYIKFKADELELYAGYTFTLAHRNYLGQNNFVPLTPMHRFAFVAMYEIEKKWRFGLEGSFTGKQYRYDNTSTPSYFFAAAMLQRNIGKHLIIVANIENIFDYRMSRVESLYNGSITNPIFKPLWAPIDGRVANISLRWKL